MELEHIVTDEDGREHRDGRRHRAPDKQRDPGLLQTGDEARSGIDADDGDKHVEPEGVHQRQRRPGDAPNAG